MAMKRIHLEIDPDVLDEARTILEDKVQIRLTTAQIVRRCIEFFVKEEKQAALT